MSDSEDLEALLPGDEPHATFHDALILRWTVDYEERVLLANLAICVGDPDAMHDADRERSREAVLRVDGLSFFVMEPPAVEDDDDLPLWLTSYGSLLDAPDPAGKMLAARLPPEADGWFLFFSNLNCFAYFAGERITCSWLEQPARRESA